MGCHTCTWKALFSPLHDDTMACGLVAQRQACCSMWRGQVMPKHGSTEPPADGVHSAAAASTPTKAIAIASVHSSHLVVGVTCKADGPWKRILHVEFCFTLGGKHPSSDARIDCHFVTSWVAIHRQHTRLCSIQVNTADACTARTITAAYQ